MANVDRAGTGEIPTTTLPFQHHLTYTGLFAAENAQTVVAVGALVCRAKESRPYDFLPAVALVLSTCALSLSTLWY